jgi:hypothetical protein
MLVERGGQLRFEAEISLQGTVAALAVDHEEFTFLDHQKHVFRTGPACPSNVSTLLRIPLSPSAVAAILLGDVSLPLAAKQTSVDWAGAHGSDVLVIVGTDGSTLWVGLHRPDPARAIWDVVFVEGQPAPASARWRVSYEDLERTSGVALPRVVRFAEPGRSFDDGVEIKVRERLLNPVFPSHAFALEPPPGYAVEHAACAPPGD